MQCLYEKRRCTEHYSKAWYNTVGYRTFAVTIETLKTNSPHDDFWLSPLNATLWRTNYQCKTLQFAIKFKHSQRYSRFTLHRRFNRPKRLSCQQWLSYHKSVSYTHRNPGIMNSNGASVLQTKSVLSKSAKIDKLSIQVFVPLEWNNQFPWVIH